MSAARPRPRQCFWSTDSRTPVAIFLESARDTAACMRLQRGILDVPLSLKSERVADLAEQLRSALRSSDGKKVPAVQHSDLADGLGARGRPPAFATSLQPLSVGDEPAVSIEGSTSEEPTLWLQILTARLDVRFYLSETIGDQLANDLASAADVLAASERDPSLTFSFRLRPATSTRVSPLQEVPS